MIRALIRFLFGTRKRTAATTTGTGSMAAVIAASVQFIGPWEGLETEAYRDIVGVWTVCYGETRNVGPDDVFTKAECDAMLADGVEDFYTGLQKCLPSLPNLPQGTQVAFVSWSYNVGLGAACGSTLVRMANAMDLRGACNELPRWNKAGGVVVRGLVNRRGGERTLCLKSLDPAVAAIEARG